MSLVAPRPLNFGACCAGNVRRDYSAFSLRQTVTHSRVQILPGDDTKELFEQIGCRLHFNRPFKSWHSQLLSIWTPEVWTKCDMWRSPWRSTFFRLRNDGLLTSVLAAGRTSSWICLMSPLQFERWFTLFFLWSVYVFTNHCRHTEPSWQCWKGPRRVGSRLSRGETWDYCFIFGKGLLPKRRSFSGNIRCLRLRAGLWAEYWAVGRPLLFGLWPSPKHKKCGVRAKATDLNRLYWSPSAEQTKMQFMPTRWGE